MAHVSPREVASQPHAPTWAWGLPVLGGTPDVFGRSAEVGEVLVEPLAVGDIEEEVPDDVPEDLYAGAMATTLAGVWLLQVKGNLRHRIELLGAEKVRGLSESQRRLNEAARMLKAPEFSEGMRQGPLGRPEIFNGAFVYVTRQHACFLSALMRSHGFETVHIQSKHVIVSDEHVSDVIICFSAQPEGQGRDAFQLRRAGELSYALWMPEIEDGEEEQGVLEGVIEGQVLPPTASRDGARRPIWRRHPSVVSSLKKMTEVIEETERLFGHRRGPEGLEGLEGEVSVSRNPERLMARLKALGDNAFEKWWSREYELDTLIEEQNAKLNKALHVGLKEMQKALYGFPLPGGRALGLGEREVPTLTQRTKKDPRPPRAPARPVQVVAISHWRPTLSSERRSESSGEV